MSSLIGPIRSQSLPSPMREHSHIKPRGTAAKKKVSGALMLTSLVDAFSILVIFLLMNSAPESADIKNNQDVKLPMAKHASISSAASTIMIVNGQYLIEDQPVTVDQLKVRLDQLALTQKEAGQVSDELLIIADQDMDFQKLNPVIIAGSRAGFSKLKFAVQQKID